MNTSRTWIRSLLVVTLVSQAVASRASADASSDEIAKKVAETLESRSTFRVGFSLGWRQVVPQTGDDVRHGKLYRDYYIDPITSALEANTIDGGDVVASAVLAAFPWREAGDWWKDYGILANVNLATFAGENVAVFNRSIEGGLGIVRKLNSDVAIAATIERVFGRRIRDQARLGAPLVVQGDTLRTIDVTDNRFFTNDNLTAFSLKVVYFIGR